jgi:hypothetical protein
MCIGIMICRKFLTGVNFFTEYELINITQKIKRSRLSEDLQFELINFLACEDKKYFEMSETLKNIINE